MSDYSSDDYIQDKYYWEFIRLPTNPNKTRLFVFKFIGVLIENVTNDGVIRISDAKSDLILEHDTFTSISSNQNGGCVFFSPGHSLFQHDICAQNVYSTIKSKYCLSSIQKSSENINFINMISISDCSSLPDITDMIWLGRGQMSISYYNSSLNKVKISPAFYLENSFGSANASYVNVIYGTATSHSIAFLNTECLLKYSNFLKNTVKSSPGNLLMIEIPTTSIDHCAFAQNTVTNLLNKEAIFTSCSFYENYFSSLPPSEDYNGTYQFIVSTLCHIGYYQMQFKQISCASRYSVPKFLLSLYPFVSV